MRRSRRDDRLRVVGLHAIARRVAHRAVDRDPRKSDRDLREADRHLAAVLGKDAG